MRIAPALLLAVACSGEGKPARPATVQPAPTFDAAVVDRADTCTAECVAESEHLCATDSSYSGTVCEAGYVRGKCLNKCGHPIPAQWTDDAECAGYCHYVEDDEGTPCGAVNLESGYTAELSAACKAALP